MQILVVDDEDKIREIIKKYALFAGYSVIEASDGMDAIAKAKDSQVDIIIMDAMMPELDGFSSCKEIRKFSDVPIIMLSARGEEYDKIHGFELGIDDYVVKPFSPRELMLRIEAVLRRYSKQAGTPYNDIFECEGLLVDFTARMVMIDGVKAEMSPKEYDLFFYLVKNRNIALSRAKLLSDVWGYDFYGDERTLDTHIKGLRKTLGQYSKYIVTLRGMGYRFENP